VSALALGVDVFIELHSLRWHTLEEKIDISRSPDSMIVPDFGTARKAS
jgi:hypothetical protein